MDKPAERLTIDMIRNAKQWLTDKPSVEQLIERAESGIDTVWVPREQE